MLKKLLMLPLMAFALVTLTAATVSEDGEDIFEWEIISENTSRPTEDADEEITYTSTDDFRTYIYDNEDTLDVYISSDTTDPARLYYNFDDKYNEYTSDNQIELNTDYGGAIADYIHIEISEYTKGEISLIGSSAQVGPSTLTDDAPGIETLDTYIIDVSVFEEIGGVLSTVVTAGSSVFVATFDGLWDVFWDADANDGEGALNWITYVAVLPVGFFLVRWGFRKILGMIQQRL